MNAEQTVRPLRLWPGVAAAALLATAALVAAFVPGVLPFAMMSAVAAGLLIVIWWTFFSRAPVAERLGAVLLMAAAVVATRRAIHPSIAGAGMGMLFYFLAIPVLGLVLAAWAVASRHLATGARRVSLVATILLACGMFTLVRTSGVTGSSPVDLHWRWTPTPEERLLAQEPITLPPVPKSAERAAQETPFEASEPRPAATPAPRAAETDERPTARATGDLEPAPAVTASDKTDASWSGFRGRARDGVVRDVRIATDWAATPPVELWRRPIGPGWSSFAVRDGRLYTQEQRGEEEIVGSYDLRTGEPVWRHSDAARFWESNAGAGPRGTPTLDGGRVYSLGATGILNVLDAGDGSVVWSRNVASDTEQEIPYWGISSSPVVTGGLVIVSVSGKLAAYDTERGQRRWLVPSHGGSYSSPHLATIDGVPQVVLLRSFGAHAVAPADGTLLWEHAWPDVGAILQPALVSDQDLLITANDMSGGVGTRRIAVAHGPDGWKVDERWTTTGLKPYFSDLVVHEGHAYGIDGRILACIDLADGKRKWKGGRFGQGQLVLLPDQDLLLVLSDEGELGLVRATPEAFTELARFKAIEGKTWNHPALVGEVLLVRNGEEMAAFRLALADRSARLSDRTSR
jgi:outer membrane protein assembly factor BamB